MKKFLIACGIVLTSGVLMAQQPPQATVNSKLAWDQPAPDLASSQAYTYKQYPDGSSTGNPLAGVVCNGTVSPFQCEVAFPVFSQGNHTLIISATNVAGEGTKSDPFAFTFVNSPGKPVNIHIK